RPGVVRSPKRDRSVDAVIVLLLLGVIWAAVLLPPWLQNRRERRPIASMASFHRQLWLLERTSPGYPAAPTGTYRSVTVYGADDDGYAYDEAYDDVEGYGDDGDYADYYDDEYVEAEAVEGGDGGYADGAHGDPYAAYS